MKFGVANSICKKNGYDFIETARFALNHPELETIQLYLDQNHIHEQYYTQFYNFYNKFANTFLLIFHFPYSIEYFHQTDFHDALGIIQQFWCKLPHEGIIFHWDGTLTISHYFQILEQLQRQIHSPVLLELVFDQLEYRSPHKIVKAFTKIILETCSSFGVKPVLDIPRFFHQQVRLSVSQSISVVQELLHEFGSREIPVYLHLIDVKHARQHREDFCAVGEGIIPYPAILKQDPAFLSSIESVILELEDPAQVMPSIQYLHSLFNAQNTTN